MEVAADTGSTATAYVDASTLTPGWHWWSLRAINAAGAGEWSESAGVTTATNVPGAPASLAGAEVAAGVQLNWTAPLDNGGSPVSGYRVWRSDGIAWTMLAG